MPETADASIMMNLYTGSPEEAISDSDYGTQ